MVWKQVVGDERKMAGRLRVFLKIDARRMLLQFSFVTALIVSTSRAYPSMKL